MTARGRRSITLRLTLLFAAMSSGVLLALGVLIGNSVESHFAAQDIDIRACLEGIDGTNWYQDDIIKIPQGQNAAAYSLIVPHNIVNGTYLVKYEVLSDLHYVTYMSYDSSVPGNAAMRWEGERLSPTTSQTVLEPMELTPGVTLSGTYTLPDPAPIWIGGL